MVKWAAWVDTKTEVKIFNSKDNEWSDIPDDGILGIWLYKGGDIETNLVYREEMTGTDHYWRVPHRDGYTYGSSNDSVKLIKKRYPGAEIKKGKWVPWETFQKYQKDAREYFF